MRHLSVLAVALLIVVLAGGCKSTHPDTYTNVTAGTSGGKTLTGKVVSFTDSTVTVETATGREVLGITSATKGRDNLMVGVDVAIHFQRSSGRGEPVATRIEPAPGPPPQPHR
ncbi:MAG TPA: hypothetical protein VGV61_04185 [Thermoanaerobaculia bacterium]|jgi:hypothetical protein|nr:hypothetical protein [Thermoanaerobaculia bacterium]